MRFNIIGYAVIIRVDIEVICYAVIITIDLRGNKGLAKGKSVCSEALGRASACCIIIPYDDNNLVKKSCWIGGDITKELILTIPVAAIGKVE